MPDAKTYVEYRMMTLRCSAITRTPHIKEVPILQRIGPSPCDNEMVQNLDINERQRLF